MLPSELTILQRVRSSLARIRSETESDSHKNQLVALDSALKELVLRCDSGFLQEQYNLGRALLEKGITLLGAKPESGLNPNLPESVSSEMDRHQVERLLDFLNDSMLKLVSAIQNTDSPAVQTLLADITEWEDRPYAHRLTLDKKVDEIPAHHYSEERLQSYLQARFATWPNLKICEYRVLAGGFSKLTIIFTTQDDLNGRQSFVIRANQPVQNIRIEGADVVNEYALIRRVFDAGLPVAEPLWLETDTGHFGTAFFASRKAPGVHLGSAHTAQTYGVMTFDIKSTLIDVMAALHNTPVDTSPIISGTFINPWRKYRSLGEMASASVDHWCAEAQKHGATMTPRILRLMHWLKQNTPEEEGDVVLVHGDYGLHNILFEDGRITAVLDWEIAKLGDPAEDLITLFIGLGGYDEELLALYTAKTGNRISRFRLIYYHLMIILRVLLFKESAMKNLEEDSRSSNDLFKWLEIMHLQARNMNDMIAEAERCRAG